MKNIVNRPGAHLIGEGHRERSIILLSLWGGEYIVLQSANKFLIKGRVHIDGSCGLKPVVGILLARLKRAGHVTHFYKDTIPMRDPRSVRLGPAACELRFSFHHCMPTLTNNFSLKERLKLPHSIEVSLRNPIRQQHVTKTYMYRKVNKGGRTCDTFRRLHYNRLMNTRTYIFLSTDSNSYLT